MFARLYQNIILEKPKLVIGVLFLCLITFGYFVKDFKLDASSDTLLIEGDPDLEYLKEINNRYGNRDFLVLTYTPHYEIINKESISELTSLKRDIQNLDWVENVITILDIPLLDNSDESVTEKLKNFKTLKDKNVDKKRGFAEILLDQPPYRGV